MTLRILLADDDEDQLFLTQRALVSQPRAVEVTTVQDGVEALAWLEAHERPHLVLLDLHMPRLGGLQVLQILRADPRFQHLPVVVLSSTLAAEDEPVLRASGATGFLAKEGNLKFFAGRLLAMLDEVLRERD